ncbi:membrane protein [Bacteroidia bacterium]|nr:membrane protein [Bacteroidia bacterium]
MLLVASGCLSSCESWLEEETFDFVSTLDDSNEGADQYAIGAYSYLVRPMIRWDEFPKVLEVDCDYVTGPGWSLRYLGAGNFQENQATDPLWNYGYALVHLTNNAIEQIEKMGNATNKDNCIGEMKFLQAWTYFIMTRAYGAIPLHKQSVSVDPDFDKPRAPITEVYAHIVDLLTAAQDQMYKNTDPNFKEGRASAGAAASLLAKVYLTMASGASAGQEIRVKGGKPFNGSGENKVFTAPVSKLFITAKVEGYDFDANDYYIKARDKAKQVIDGEYGSYDLLPYDQLWSIAMRHKTEHLFMIQSVQSSDQYGAGISTYYTGTTDGSEVIITGLFHGCTNHWYRLFDQDPQDLRVQEGVMHRWINEPYHNSWNGGGFYPDDETWENVPSRGIWASKALGYYIDEGTGAQVAVAKDKIFDDGRDYVNDGTDQYIAHLTKYFNATDRSQTLADVPYPILRFADVLLIYAEAADETGQDGEAKAALNRVRERSRATAFPSVANAESDNEVGLRSAIFEERAKELALESDRRWDLIRMGIYLGVMNALEGPDEVDVNKERQNKHLLYPLPSDVILTNKNISGNNPGW